MTVHPDDDDEEEMQPDTPITIAMDGTDQLRYPPIDARAVFQQRFINRTPSDVCVPQSPTVLTPNGHQWVVGRINYRHHHNPQSPTVPQNRIELFIADVPWAILPSAFPSASVDEIPALVSHDGEIPEVVSDDGETLGGF